jgi:lysophospholipase L1-like esterase
MEVLAHDLQPLLAAQGLEVIYAEANRGKSTAWYVAQGKFGAEVAQYKPDFLLIELGTNDQPNASYEATLRAAVEQVRRAGSTEILWFGPSYSSTSLEARLEAIRDRQEATLPALGVHWFDSFPMTQRGHGPDGVHFTQAGYRSWASGMAAEIAVVPRPMSMLPFVALTFAAVVAGAIIFSRFNR